MEKNNKLFKYAAMFLFVLLVTLGLPSQVSFGAGAFPGDINEDNTVDFNDLEIFAANWLGTPCDDANQFCNGADIDDSNNVDFIDYAWLAQDWLKVNLPPVVDAGPDQTITYHYPDPTSANLDGTVSDDGLPDPPAAVTTLWTKESGPGTVTFDDANAVDAVATFPDAGGVFVLRLTANDDAASAYDEVTITVIGKPLWSETADFYVDGRTGDNGNTGSANLPFKTIDFAADKLNGTSAKDKVLVWGGQTYVEQVSPIGNGSASYPNTIRRDPTSGEAIIDANGSSNGAVYINQKSYITLDGFTVTNTNGLWGIYVYNDTSDNITIKNCRIRDVSRYGIIDREGDNLTINNCAVYNVNTSGGSFADIYIWGSTGSVTGCQITSCSIYGGGNTTGKYGIQALATATISSIKNCIITNHKMGGGYGILKDTGGGAITSIFYCDVWNNTTNYSTNCPAPTNSISSDPKFVDPANGDFHLGTGSPCKNTGEGGIDMGYRYLDTAL